MQFKTFYWLSYYGISASANQDTIISKYGKCTRQLKFKFSLKKQWRPAKIASHRIELNEKEVIELLENATPGNIKKATNYGMKIFQGKNFKTLF